MRETAAVWLIVAFVVMACGSPAAKSALDVIGPIAADALSALIKDHYGSETDESSAGCFELPADFEDEAGYVYILCRAKPVSE